MPAFDETLAELEKLVPPTKKTRGETIHQPGRWDNQMEQLQAQIEELSKQLETQSQELAQTLKSEVAEPTSKPQADTDAHKNIDKKEKNASTLLTPDLQPDFTSNVQNWTDNPFNRDFSVYRGHAQPPIASVTPVSETPTSEEKPLPPATDPDQTTVVPIPDGELMVGEPAKAPASQDHWHLMRPRVSPPVPTESAPARTMITKHPEPTPANTISQDLPHRSDPDRPTATPTPATDKPGTDEPKTEVLQPDIVEANRQETPVPVTNIAGLQHARALAADAPTEPVTPTKILAPRDSEPEPAPVIVDPKAETPVPPDTQVDNSTPTPAQEVTTTDTESDKADTSTLSSSDFALSDDEQAALGLTAEEKKLLKKMRRRQEKRHSASHGALVALLSLLIIIALALTAAWVWFGGVESEQYASEGHHAPTQTVTRESLQQMVATPAYTLTYYPVGNQSLTIEIVHSGTSTLVRDVTMGRTYLQKNGQFYDLGPAGQTATKLDQPPAGFDNYLVLTPEILGAKQAEESVSLHGQLYVAESYGDYTAYFQEGDLKIIARQTAQGEPSEYAIQTFTKTAAPDFDALPGEASESTAPESTQAASNKIKLETVAIDMPENNVMGELAVGQYIVFD